MALAICNIFIIFRSIKRVNILTQSKQIDKICQTSQFTCKQQQKTRFKTYNCLYRKLLNSQFESREAHACVFIIPRSSKCVSERNIFSTLTLCTCLRVNVSRRRRKLWQNPFKQSKMCEIKACVTWIIGH